MHNNDAHADQTQQNDVMNHGVLEVFVNHGIAAVFYDDGLAIVFLNVRQRLNQHLRTVFLHVFEIFEHYLSFPSDYVR